jgi:large subunit ribosomal protein L33
MLVDFRIQIYILMEVIPMRVHITLECTECHNRQYLSNKNKRNNPDRLELNKYCPRERKVTLHKETK